MLAATSQPLEPSVPSPEDAQLAEQGSRLLAACIGRGPTARLRVIDGDKDITVPVAALHLLVDILAQMARGNAVTVVPINAELTTQQAADFLNVSRPFLIGLLEQGKVPYRKVGTHRRVRFQDLAAYQKVSQSEQRKAADALAREAQDLGLGY